jgi:hypothetical protein
MHSTLMHFCQCLACLFKRQPCDLRADMVSSSKLQNIPNIFGNSFWR